MTIRKDFSIGRIKKGLVDDFTTETITSSQTWTVPGIIKRHIDGNYYVWLTMSGGGASGGVVEGSEGYAGGGQAGDFCVRYKQAVTPGDDISITIGAGGTGITANGNGDNGATTSFGALVSVDGGVGGKYVGSGASGADGGGQNGQWGDVIDPGSNDWVGQPGAVLQFSGAWDGDNLICHGAIGGAAGGNQGGTGGTSPVDSHTGGSGVQQGNNAAGGGGAGLFGNGTDGTVTASSASASAAANSGAGSGGAADTDASMASGDGGSGKCIIEYYEN